MNEQRMIYTQVAWSDIWRLCKRSKKKILLTIFLSASLLGVLSLLQPVEYETEGTFREKNLKSGQMNHSLMDMFMFGNLNSSDNEAVSVLKSRKLIQPIITKYHLQGYIQSQKDFDRYQKRLQDNVIVSYAYLTRKNHPILPDVNSSLKFTHLNYAEELPLNFKIKLPLELEDASYDYELFSLENDFVGQGKFGQLYQGENFNFILDKKTTSETILENVYFISILPLNLQINLIKDKLRVENDFKDKQLIKVSYRHRDRYAARDFVNTLLETYHQHLHDDHERQADLQLAYLKTKQKESGQHLENLMTDYAVSLSADLNRSGFSDSEKEMEFLAKSQQEFKERLISNKLEMKRLQNVQIGKCVYYDQSMRNLGDHNIINAVLEEIRDAQQQRDSLSLALAKSAIFSPIDAEIEFLIQKKELQEIQNYKTELEEIMACVLNNQPILSKSFSLFDHPRYVIQAWYKKLVEKNSVELEEKSQFLHYLENLNRLFSVHENVIKERLVHQQNVHSEFQGINLKTAQDLYLEYSRKLNEIEGKKREHLFLIDQMQDENFEITSLSTVLHDPVSHEMIQKASHLLLDLKDQNNRSDKEQLQLKEELALERTFLLLHLKQTNELLLLHEQLLEEKIQNLQNITLELIHQHISVLEKNLADYINTRLENLKQERLLIEEQIHQLHSEMAALPERWIAEKMIEQNLSVHSLIVQEVAKMVESKNISHHLELIQSAPLDLAALPLHPTSPHFLLFSILGAIIGGMISLAMIFKKALLGNLPASSTSLKLLNQQVIGNFSSPYFSKKNKEITEDDLETLRRLKSYLDDNNSLDRCQKWLLIQGRGLNYSSDLSKLLLINGKKVIRIFLNFDLSAEGNQGLLQFLKGEISTPEILKDEAGDYIETGGTSRFYHELLGTPPFQHLLEFLAEKYNYIIGVSSTKLNSAIAEHLTSFFSQIAITVDKENLNEFSFYFQKEIMTNKKIAYIMTSTDDKG